MTQNFSVFWGGGESEWWIQEILHGWATNSNIQPPNVKEQVIFSQSFIPLVFDDTTSSYKVVALSYADKQHLQDLGQIDFFLRDATPHNSPVGLGLVLKIPNEWIREELNVSTNDRLGTTQTELERSSQQNEGKCNSKSGLKV